jgi:hypothetical protein
MNNDSYLLELSDHVDAIFIILSEFTQVVLSEGDEGMQEIADTLDLHIFLYGSQSCEIESRFDISFSVNPSLGRISLSKRTNTPPPQSSSLFLD